MLDNIKSFQSAILSGFIIAFVSYAYASTNASMFGTILFTFGLLSVVFYNLHLFTGDAGFIMDSYDNEDLFMTLFGNVGGCVLGTFLLSFTSNESIDIFVKNALTIREVNNFHDVIKVLIKAIGCGLILTVSVKFAREARDNNEPIKILPLLFGVPLFLTAGFYHCIVDIFYIIHGSMIGIYEYGMEDAMYSIIGWFFVALGNLIGCNIPRIIMFDREF